MVAMMDGRAGERAQRQCPARAEPAADVENRRNIGKVAVSQRRAPGPSAVPAARASVSSPSSRSSVSAYEVNCDSPSVPPISSLAISVPVSRYKVDSVNRGAYGVFRQVVA